MDNYSKRKHEKNASNYINDVIQISSDYSDEETSDEKVDKEQMLMRNILRLVNTRSRLV